MAINEKHPLYAATLPDWQQMRDTYAGERAVKEKGAAYLPPTSGQVADGVNSAEQLGYKAYQAYKTRANFPDIVREAVEAMVGVMHHKPPVIELPARMEPLLERCNLQGESLEMMLRRINEEQLSMGRLGLMLDVETGQAPGALPYLAMYDATSIINWDDGTRDELVKQVLNLVVLDESEYARKADFSWEWVEKYRVLVLGDPTENEAIGVYQTGVVQGTSATFDPTALVIPSLTGRTLQEIPFVFINSKDIVPAPDTPPLLGISNLALTIYRGDADYRQALFMQGQDTLVVIGSTEEGPIRTGANAVIKIPSGQGNDAKFIGVDSEGLPEMREAQQNDFARAAQKGGQLMDSVSRERESGDALKVRVAARTATLNSIALSGAFGLEQILKVAARWVGADENEVKVTPNLDFIDDTMAPDDLGKMIGAKIMGFPLSLESMHKLAQDRGITEFSFEEELDKIAKEEPLVGGTDEGGDDDEDEDGDGEANQ